jgi:hypothetical protein
LKTLLRVGKGLRVTKSDPAQLLPTSVQKSYFMLTDAERGVLNTALEKYRPGQSEPILVGGKNLLKLALRLMTWYRLVIEEIKDAEVIKSYTRWVDAVQVKGAEDQEVFLTFSPRFEHIWLESKKRLMGYGFPETGQYWTSKSVGRFDSSGVIILAMPAVAAHAPTSSV